MKNKDYMRIVASSFGVLGVFVLTFIAAKLELLAGVFSIGCVSGLGEIPVPESLQDK